MPGAVRVYPPSEGSPGWSVADDGGWLPGIYASEEAARLAAGVPYGVVLSLTMEDRGVGLAYRLITTDELIQRCHERADRLIEQAKEEQVTVKPTYSEHATDLLMRHLDRTGVSPLTFTDLATKQHYELLHHFMIALGAALEDEQVPEDRAYRVIDRMILMAAPSAVEIAYRKEIEAAAIRAAERMPVQMMLSDFRYQPPGPAPDQAVKPRLVKRFTRPAPLPDLPNNPLDEEKST